MKCQPLTYLSHTHFSLKHRLRPADFRVIAALGDGLTSGQGALSTGITTASKAFRGVSFATGNVFTIINVVITRKMFQIESDVYNKFHETDPRKILLKVCFCPWSRINVWLNFVAIFSASSPYFKSFMKIT